jgi:hypothetical protein
MNLANERCCLEAVECGVVLGETALAKEQRHSLLVVQATELALATAQVAVLVDLVLPKHFMARYHSRAMQR